MSAESGTETWFEPMEAHLGLRELKYDAAERLRADFDGDSAAEEEFSALPSYHLVETCVPRSVSLDDCNDEGYLTIVIGQEVYEDSPFTQ